MSDDKPRARVFISCGQSDNGDERDIANRIRDTLIGLDFDPYVAVKEQSLQGFTNNIFPRLRDSEYFLFVDFKREEIIANNGRHGFRGSLFSHQELAIASYLQITPLIFQERGMTREGLMSYLQTNPIPFDRDSIHRMIDHCVKESGWISNWKNELVLEVPNPTDNVKMFGNGKLVGFGRYFHVNVRNYHRDKLASNCSAYLEKIVDRENLSLHFKTIELKWAGTSWPTVGIAAGSVRAFDALSILNSEPLRVQFHVHTDSPEYMPQLPQEAGSYELHYLVTSSDFRPVRVCCLLQLMPTTADTTFAVK